MSFAVIGHCECTWGSVQGHVFLTAYLNAAYSCCLHARWLATWLLWRSRLPAFLPFHEILGAAASKRAPLWRWCCWAAWRPPAHGIDVHTFRRKHRKPCLWAPVAWRLACQVLCCCACRAAAAAAGGCRREACSAHAFTLSFPQQSSSGVGSACLYDTSSWALPCNQAWTLIPVTARATCIIPAHGYRMRR